MFLVDLDKVERNSVIISKEGKWYSFFEGMASELIPIVSKAELTPEQINQLTECELDGEQQ